MSVTANFAGPVQTDAINRFRMLQSMAAIEQNVAQPLNSGANTVIAFTAGAKVNANTDAMWATGKPTRLTPQITGNYLVMGTVAYPDQATAAGNASVFLRKNGTTILNPVVSMSYPTSIGNATVAQISSIVPLTAPTDYLELMGQQATNAQQTVGQATFFMLYVGE